MEDRLITAFIPAQAVEARNNTSPGFSLENKLNKAMRRNLSHGDFTEGDIVENTPFLFIKKYYFDFKRMGYDVIAEIINL